MVMFGKWLNELSGPGQDVTNWVVKWTAATLFRRYYVHHTMADVSPKEIMLGCMLLAAKVEECRLVTTEGLHVWRDKNYSIQQIVEAESTVAAGVTFDLHVFSPSVSLSGLFDLLTSKCTELTTSSSSNVTKGSAESEEKASSTLASGISSTKAIEVATAALKTLQDKTTRAEILEDLETLLYSDAVFLFAPAKLALSAATTRASTLPLKEAITLLLNLELDDKVASYLVKSTVSAEEGKLLDAKLERVRNPLYNRDSEAYKQKMLQKERAHTIKQEEKLDKMSAERQDNLAKLSVTELPKQ